MKKIILFFLLIPLLSIGQQAGISFEHNSSWEKIKAKAKAENKHIFVDCFTTWCGPCKYMSNNVFTQEKVGDYFNKNFVNLKIQMDKTKSDSEDVKSWYEEAVRFEKDYSVKAYPTFLIFNPEGELVHRIVGGGEADQFIAKAADGLNPETQYVTLVNKFNANPTDVSIAKKLAIAAQTAYDQKTGVKAIEAFVNAVGVDGALTKENIGLVLQGATQISSPSFKLIRDNKEKVDALLGGKGRNANDILSSVLIYELVLPKMRDENAVVDFEALKSTLKSDYADINMDKMLARSKSQYYMSKKNWPQFKDAVNEYLLASNSTITAQELNSFAWSVFENCDDPACLNAALAWSKQSLEKGEDAAYLDTYANILYKTGDKKNAIVFQEKALQLAAADEKETYQTTLDKMKSGKPTWE